ncbi:heterokaryon incompatibility protein-domain-containing protein [Apodospora peruviana]|uniref:Heterokaryon incompatibility protein-domain-containing protein n=1 Tax=Apodospora peruviana TaxID=516989 RepID=A0AAE0HTJ9_9PEZI|nr:heterokaryon incompatibility protein-domain-containing protein [Apodospora peruviana]
MRLINAETLEFEDFFNPSSVDYAILSHTWEAEEVTFQDMVHWSPAVKKKAGFIKIRETCRLARHKGLKYVWIDTCCIDKSSSAELSEAINSMFNWYAQSTVCFAQLSDLRPSVGFKTQDLEKCRWFRRGWTLQELIAPSVLELYDSDWLFRGTKQEHWEAIQDVSGISKAGFLNFKPDDAVFPVAQRMYWASRRETTRPEDMSYCLFGIFDVNMPLLYGEGGTKAFMRLQRAILEATQDLTILAWKLPAAQDDDAMSIEGEQAVTACGVLAPHPRAFDHPMMRLFQTAKKVYHRGTDALGYRVHVDGLYIRITCPRISTLKGQGDQIFLSLDLSFQLEAESGRGSSYPRMWMPITQVGNTYARMGAATGEPILDTDTTLGCAPIQEMALVADPSKTFDAHEFGSSLKFQTLLPRNIILHGLDAGPKDSWNPLTQSFTLRGKRWDSNEGYLGIRLRRTNGRNPFNGGARCHPSWLDRVHFVLPWKTTCIDSTWAEEPFITWEFFAQILFLARKYDGSTSPKDWLQYNDSQGGRTHFTDEASVMQTIMNYVYTDAHMTKTLVLFVGDSTVNEAIRCRVAATTTTPPDTEVRETPQKFDVKLEVEDVSWVAALEASRQDSILCIDFKESLPVNVTVQVGQALQ